MQTQWPGLGTGFDPTSLDAAAAHGRPVWTGGPFGTGLPPQPLDAIARTWWTCGTPNANGNTAGPFWPGSLAGGFGALFGLMNGLITALQQLAGALANGAGTPSTGGGPYAGGAQQRFANVDVSSTGDPHIAETGTTTGHGTPQTIDDRWDSMTAHGDLVHCNDVEGGYRVSTAVTAPAANGVTFNQSATVHTNFDQAAVTMNRDGSYAIYDNGEQLQLGAGESAMLSGGERVDVNQDGSLAVSAQSANGGTITTTLRSTGVGVDVTTHGSNIAIGGDAVAHAAPKATPQHPHLRRPAAPQTLAAPAP